MSRRTLITIAVGVLIALFIGGIWWWFFAAGGAPGPKTSQGTFGTGGNRSAPSSQSSGQNTNIPSQVGQAPGDGGNAGQGGLSSGTPSSGSPGGASFSVPTLAGSNLNVGGELSGSAPGANWLAGGGLGSAGYGYGGGGLNVGGGPQSGTPTSGTPNTGTFNPGGGPTSFPGGPGTTISVTSGGGTVFTPAQINDLNNSQVGGTLVIPGTNVSSPSGSNGNGLAIGLIAGTAVGCAAFLVPNISSVASLQTVPTNDTANNQKSFMDCLMRTIARAALQQLTNSVVQWINSGFNGSPSFVTNYQQFFESVADQAAGTFIANVANFSPLCTPFQAQIRVALAQSYARRNTAPSCTLSKLLGTNTQGLFSGNTNGWSNLLQFTTVPSNNPYGAYMSVQTNLQNTIASANQNAQRNMTAGGFLNFQQPYDCSDPSKQSSAVVGTCPQGCKCKVTTPGSVIESSLQKTLGVSQDYLTQAGISGSFDAIINALITQLTQRALYSGLTNVSTGDYGVTQTFDQQTAQAQGQYLITQLQGLVTAAQQYGQAEQGSISDIESAQQNLSNLYNCWAAAASSTQDATKQQQADTNANTATSTLHSYDSQIATLNSNITRANSAIALLQNLQTQTLSAGSTADVAAVQSAFNNAQAQGQLIAQTDLTQAQQDRTTLQTQLSSLNTQTQTGMAQCSAFETSSNQSNAGN